MHVVSCMYAFFFQSWIREEKKRLSLGFRICKFVTYTHSDVKKIDLPTVDQLTATFISNAATLQTFRSNLAKLKHNLTLSIDCLRFKRNLIILKTDSLYIQSTTYSLYPLTFHYVQVPRQYSSTKCLTLGVRFLPYILAACHTDQSWLQLPCYKHRERRAGLKKTVTYLLRSNKDSR